MKTLTISTCAAVAALALIASPHAQAATASLTTTVAKVLVSADDTFGGCMAALAGSPSNKLATCGTNWVTFDCAGVFANTDIVRAYRMLDQAQLAYTLKKNVIVIFTDTLKANGYCFATRIDLLP
jgi:hypothetical protein